MGTGLTHTPIKYMVVSILLIFTNQGKYLFIFSSILIRIYVNIFFVNDEKLKELIPDKFKMQIYRKIVFSAAADLMWEICLNVKFNSFLLLSIIIVVALK